MRAVVTGGGGFIGSHLIEALVARGDEVVCVERPDASRRWIHNLPITYLDTGLDRKALEGAMRGAHAVFHLAGLTEARSPKEFYRINTEGTAGVLIAATATQPNPPQVILLSSLAALGPCQNGEPLSPDSVPFPMSHYGRSKLLAEAVMHAYADRVPTTVLRLPSVYGPRERGVLTLFKLVKRGVALTVGDWDRELSMIYVKDLVHGLLRCVAEPGGRGRTYCLSHPEPTTWRGFAAQVGVALGRTPRLVSIPPLVARGIALTFECCAALAQCATVLDRDRVREIAQRRWVCDPTRAVMEIGFAPEYGVARGVAETAAWYREAQWI